MAAYIIVKLFDGTAAPTRNDVFNDGNLYIDYTYQPGSTPIQVERVGMGSPYDILISGTYKTISRIKVCWYYSPSVVPPSNLRINPVFGALYDGSHRPVLYWGAITDGTPGSSVSLQSLSTDSGLTDSSTGLKIYYGTTAGQVTPASTLQVDTYGTPIYNTLQDALNAMNDGIWSHIVSEDPYNPGGFTDKEGGTGTFDGTSTPIDFPPLPTISVSDTGFVNIYNPTLTQLQNLATFMWTNPLFDLSQWRALFANPMQAILSLAILPVAIPNGGTRTIKVGNISTDVSMTLAAQQFIEFDCGSLNINEYWGSYLDYSPFTRLSIFLPFVGYRDLNIDECMNKTLQVKYYIDIFTGACSAFIKCGSSVLYNFSGNCAFNVPISGTDFSSVVNGVLSAVSTGVTALATGGESAAFGAVASMSADVMNAKPHVQKGGSMGGNAGFLGHRTPYLILIRPRQAVPQNQNEFLGYPSFITADLANVTGYTEVINIFLQDGFTATENELNEIKRLLSEGVIL